MGCIPGKSKEFKIKKAYLNNSTSENAKIKNYEKDMKSKAAQNNNKIFSENDCTNKSKSKDKYILKDSKKIQFKPTNIEPTTNKSSKSSLTAITNNKTNEKYFNTNTIKNIERNNEKLIDDNNNNNNKEGIFNFEIKDKETVNHQIVNKIQEKCKIKVTTPEVNNVKHNPRPLTTKQLSKINDNLRKLDVSVQLLKNISHGNPKKEQTIYDDSIVLTVEAEIYEKLIPIMTKENEKITFNVQGQWKIDNDLAEFDSRGYTNIVMKGFNLGALLCRVGGEDKYFTVYDGLEYTPSVSGPLFFITNCDSDRKPQGTLQVHIKNALKYSIDELDKKIGWNTVALNKLLLEPDNIFLSKCELEQFKLINKLRMNPALFTKIYLMHLKNESESLNSLISKLLNMKPLKPIRTNSELKGISNSICKDLIHKIKFNLDDFKLNLDIQKLEQDKSIKFDIDRFKSIFIVPLNNPLQIVPKLLEKNQILLTESIELMGITIKQNDKSDWICVLCFQN